MSESISRSHENDLISRQAAIDALRYTQHRFTVADEAGGIGTVKWSEDVIYFAAAEKVLADLPSAQPEVIRCKNCVHWWESHKMCKRNKDKNHNCACMDCDADFYCKNAERREE